MDSLFRLSATQGRALFFPRLSLLVALPFVSLSSLADVEHLEFSGTLAQNWSYNSSQDTTQKLQTTLMPRLDVSWANGNSLTGIARLRFDDASRLGAYPNGNSAHAEIRELYLDTCWQESFWRIGKQQVVWGQSDGLRVLDVVNPLDYREFILGSFEDRRIPLWMVNAEFPVSDAWMAQLLWIPDQQYNEMAPTDSQFRFTSPVFVPQFPPSPGGPPVLLDAQQPDNWLEDSDIGIRLTAFLDGWDISLNYIYHYLDQPVLYRNSTLDGHVIAPEFERSHLLGSSLSNVFGNTILRMELGYATEQFYLQHTTSESAETKGIHSSDELSYVIGLDWQPGSQWLLSTQLFQSTLLDFNSSVIRDRTVTQVTGLIQKGLFNESLNLRALIIHDLDVQDTAYQLEARFEYSTSLQLLLGIDIFDGDATGLFGQFEAADRITLGANWSF